MLRMKPPSSRVATLAAGAGYQYSLSVKVTRKEPVLFVTRKQLINNFHEKMFPGILITIPLHTNSNKVQLTGLQFSCSDSCRLSCSVWYCAWFSYLLDSSEYKSLTQNVLYTFWFNTNVISHGIKMTSQNLMIQ